MEKGKILTRDFCIKFIVAFLFASIWFLLFLDDYQYNKTIAVFGSVLLLTISVLALIKVRKKLSLLIMFAMLLYFNYSIVYYFYLTDNRFSGSIYATFSHSSVAMTGLICLLLFNLIVYLFLPSKIKEAKDVKYIREENNNSVLVLGTVVVCLLIFLFAYTRPTVEGQRGSPSTIYEYSIILFIIGFYYCGKQKALRYCLIGVLLLVALQNLIFGGRVTGLQLFIVLLLTNFPHINKKILVIGSVIVFVWMIGIGAMRARFSLSGIGNVLLGAFKGGLALDTAYSSYHTSMTFIKVEEITSFSSKMGMFGRWLLSMIFGGSLIEDSNLAYYTLDFYPHTFGGVLPVFMYFYLGFPGAIIIALLVAFYIRRLFCKDCGGLGKGLAIYIMATTPRWYLYSPSQMIRGVMLFVLVFYAFKLVDYLLNPLNPKKSEKLFMERNQ